MLEATLPTNSRPPLVLTAPAEYLPPLAYATTLPYPLHPNATVDHYPFQAAPLAAGSAEQKVGDERWLSVARLAWERSGRKVPIRSVTVSLKGGVIQEDWLRI